MKYGSTRQQDYERLLAFRTGLRRFLSWSGQQAEAAGLVARQTDASDARTVRLVLTGHGAERLETLAADDLTVASRIQQLVGDHHPVGRAAPGTRAGASPASSSARWARPARGRRSGGHPHRPGTRWPGRHRRATIQG